MSTTLEEIIEKSQTLLPGEKADLARILIEELDSTSDPDAEALWIAEARRRYDSYQRGEIGSSPVNEVLARVRARLK